LREIDERMVLNRLQEIGGHKMEGTYLRRERFTTGAELKGIQNKREKINLIVLSLETEPKDEKVKKKTSRV
jgi:hypothetical protein